MKNNDKFLNLLIHASIISAPLYLIRFSIFGIPTNILEILVFASFLFWFTFGKELSFFTKIRKEYFLGIIFIFIGLTFSTIINGENIIGLGIIKGWFIVPLIFSVIIVSQTRKIEEITNILKTIYLSSSLVSIVSMAYLISGRLTYDQRLKAFYLSPNHLAMFLAPSIIIGIFLIYKKYRENNLKNPEGILFMASFLVVSLILFSTYSFATIFSVIAAILVICLLFISKIKKSFLIVSLVSILLFSVTGAFEIKTAFNNLERSSLSSRTIIWKSGSKILKDNIVWGIGPGNFQNKYLEYQKHFPPYLEWAVPQPHNLYLAFWLQSGIIGLTGFLIILVIWIRDVYKITTRQENGLAPVLMSIIAYIAIHGLVDTPYWKNDLAFIFWIIIICGIILKNIAGKTRPPIYIGARHAD